MTVLLALLLLASPDVPERSSSLLRCRESCERHLRGTTAAGLCGRCLTAAGGGRAAWVEALLRSRPVPRQLLLSVLEDEDWAVRWAALQGLARLEGRPEKSYLATWVMKAQGRAALRACITAARAAASRKLSSAELLAAAGADGPRAAARVWELREEIRRELEIELYASNAEVRLEALEHLARFLGRSPGRVVLDALATRPPSTDAIAAQLLEEDCERRGTTLEAALLRGARPEDRPRVDRLLGVYASELDGLRGKLKEKEPAARRGAVAGLRRLMPLSSRELKLALADGDPSVQLLAGRALARAEGRTLPEHVRVLSADWSAPGGGPAEARLRWIELAGRSGDKDCAPVLKALSRDLRLDQAVRAAAVTALGTCTRKEAVGHLLPGLADPDPAIRAAAVRSLASAPRKPAAAQAAALALQDEDPEVVVSAIATVTAQGQGGRVGEIAALLKRPEAKVREAAVQGLERIPGGGGFVKELAERLRNDDSPGVRGAAAVALGTLGGPVAASALAEATKDPDGHVQYVARDALHRLGFR